MGEPCGARGRERFEPALLDSTDIHPEHGTLERFDSVPASPLYKEVVMTRSCDECKVIWPARFMFPIRLKDRPEVQICPKCAAIEPEKLSCLQLTNE